MCGTYNFYFTSHYTLSDAIKHVPVVCNPCWFKGFALNNKIQFAF